MTQPVQETTTPRDIAGSQWATSQLARRPPLSSCPCDSEWLVAAGVFNETNWVSGSFTTITWNTYYEPPGLTALVHNVDNAPFKVLKHGIYNIAFDLEWQAAAGATDDRYYSCGFSSPPLNWDSGSTPFEMSNTRNVSTGNLFVNSIILVKGTTVSFRGMQTSGSNKDVATAFATITYEGPLLGIDPDLTGTAVYDAFNALQQVWH